MTRRLAIPIAVLLLALLVGTPAARAADLATDLQSLHRAWVIAHLQTPARDEQLGAFEKLASRARALVAAYPGRAEPLVWQGIVLSTWAKAKGSLGALSLASQARAALEAAERIDPEVLEGTIYTTLGTLYFKLPGWPVSFGSDDKARAYLKKALALRPDAMDPNFFYAEFLVAQGKPDEAQRHLERALRAADRPERAASDRARREEARALLEKLRSSR